MANWVELRKTATMIGTFGSFLLLGYLAWQGSINNFVVKDDLRPLEEKISKVEVKIDKVSNQLMTLTQGLLFQEPS